MAQKDLAGIFAINDPSALGAYAAVEKAGLAGKVADLTKGQSQRTEESITAAYFAARHGDPPTRAELKQMGVGR